MNITLNVEDENVKGVNMDLTAIEFMVLRHTLNLQAVNTELNEADRQVAERMYSEMDKQIKGVNKC